jgi:hypothetical protein
MNENLKRAFDAAQKLPDATQEKIAKHVWQDIEEQSDFLKVPLDEGMAAYHKIKKQYDDVFQELAKL